MPYTRKQVKYLLSNGSPLTADQKTKMLGELHADPSLGHAQKKTPDSEGHTYNWRSRNNLKRGK
jgi:hypothetical protein